MLTQYSAAQHWKCAPPACDWLWVEAADISAVVFDNGSWWEILWKMLLHFMGQRCREECIGARRERGLRWKGGESEWEGQPNLNRKCKVCTIISALVAGGSP